jgi:peptide/nickel transport system permease protein
LLSSAKLLVDAVGECYDSGCGALTDVKRSSSGVRHPVVAVVGRRLALAIPLLLVVSALSFILVSATPGDPARTFATSSLTSGSVDQSAYQAFRKKLGLDQPIYERYWVWLRQAAEGNLGRSWTGESVTTVIRARFPVTLSLVLLSLFVITIVGVSLGVFGAVRGGVSGRFVDSVSLVGFALPGFWVGAMLISIFAVNLHWFPAVGYVPLTSSPTDWVRSLILPVAALALYSVAILAKQTREAMLDALSSEHVRMAWANGIPARRIYFQLSIKNAAPRIVTIVGLQAVGLLAGTLFIEQVFALPGLGSTIVSAASQGDLPIVQGITVFFTLIIVVINLAVDLSYSWLDPRVRTS